jgi:hypothetical protein
MYVAHKTNLSHLHHCPVLIYTTALSGACVCACVRPCDAHLDDNGCFQIASSKDKKVIFRSTNQNVTDAWIRSLRQWQYFDLNLTQQEECEHVKLDVGGCNGHCLDKIERSLRPLLSHIQANGVPKASETTLRESSALITICKGVEDSRMDGALMKQMVDGGAKVTDRLLEVHMADLQNAQLGGDQLQSLRRDTAGVPAQDVVLDVVKKFAAELRTACVYHQLIPLDDFRRSELEVKVVGHEIGEEVSKLTQLQAAAGKDYYILECSYTVRSGDQGQMLHTSKVYRRWDSLKGFFKLPQVTKDSSKQLRTIMSQAAPPKPPSCSSNTEDRTAALAGYFEEWCKWEDRVRGEHDFAVSELRNVWDFLTANVILA